MFRAASELLAEGRSPYSLDNQLQNIADSRLEGELPPFALPFSYPPNSLPLFQLRALGDPETNAAIHLSATVFVSLLCLSLLIHRYIDNSMTRLVIIATAAFWTPAILDMMLAQTGHLAALLAFCLLWAHDRKPVLAGIALGLLAFKPQYAIPLGLVVMSRQNWSLLITAAVTFILTCLISALLYGWEMWPAFWQNARSLNATIYHMESWLGAAALLMQENLLTINQLAIPVYGLGMLLLGSALVVVGNRLDLLGAASLAMAVTLVLSPNTHPYDLMLFNIPMLYIIRYFGMRMWFAVIAYAVFFLPNIFVPLSILRFCFLVLSCFLIVWIIRSEIRNGIDGNPKSVA